MNYDNILTAEHGDGALRTGVITLNRPKQLNALNDALMDDLGAALKACDADDGIGCIVVTGSEQAPRPPSSANPRSSLVSFPARGARSACRERWAKPRRWIWC